ncbi:MAG TPA: alpha/beta fold hydrolase [Candidatus Tectomicrobia bacterium]|nr:alpha/beta fold hydrolase [Candidatus Tectomicrobia bacterium]
MPHARVNGVDLYHEVHGQGDWLALVHEFSGWYRSWEPQLPAFAREYRVLVYSCRGYPPSTVPADPAAYSQEASIEDLRALMDHLGIARAHVGGFSMGGSIALNFGLAYPARVRSLVLAGTGTGSIDKEQFRREFGPIADQLEREGPARVAETYLRGPTRIQLLRKNPAMWQKLFTEFAGLSGTGLANTLRRVQLMRPTMYELADRLPSVRVPALVIVGEEDAPALEPSRFLAKQIPGARLEVLPATGHTLNLEEPERFNAAVLDFLRGASARAPRD